jgi:acyl transferase domain-containing protein
MLSTDLELSVKYKSLGSFSSLLSNRVSWFFDFKAPSLTVDTACSGSMIALHLGCQSLRCGESNMVSQVHYLECNVDQHTYERLEVCH